MPTPLAARARLLYAELSQLQETQVAAIQFTLNGKPADY